MKKVLLAFVLVATCGLAVVWWTELVQLRSKEPFGKLPTDTLVGRQPEGHYLVPTNQLLKPLGDQLLIRGRPVELAFNSTKTLLAILNWHSVLLIDPVSNEIRADVSLKSTSYTGLAFRPGDRELWTSEVTRSGPDSLQIVRLTSEGNSEGVESVRLVGHPTPTGIAFSDDGSTAYVALSRNNSLALIDAESRRFIREIEVGIAPVAVVVSSRYGRIFVSNRGGRRPGPKDFTAPSSGSDVIVDPVTGAAISGTVSAIAIGTEQVQEIDVGLAPSLMALSSDQSTLAVANGHSDSISLVDAESLSASEVKIPTWPAGTLGSQPVDLTFSQDGRTIFVACAGSNAIAVVEREGADWRVAGAVPSIRGNLPTAWFPSAITVDPEGSLRVVNVKGIGNTADDEGTFNSREYEGSLSRISPLGGAELSEATRIVEAANQPRFTPAGGVENLESLGIEHVFLIIKENRTYDQVFSDIEKGNGDPRLLMFGREITPNHHSLAERYVLLDNFYASGAISFDGHHWLMQAFVSDYVERAFAASPRGYAWNMADALTVSPAGFFWQGGPRELELRIYGEFALPARWDAETQSVIDIDEGDLLSWTEYWQSYQRGEWRDKVRSRSGVPVLEKFLSSKYPPSTMFIPDQIRAAAFLEELAEMEKSGKAPHLSIFTLPADHTRGTRPESPTPRAMVADNDLALGRMVEGISKSRFWPKSLILVVEDDAQNGLDHVDGHRTVALAIGPQVRRETLDSNNYNHTSMIRTIQEIFQIPARTRFLKSARAMNSIFTSEADMTPYEALTPAVALDEMNPPLEALEGKRLWAAKQSLAMNWEDVDDVPFDVLNRILWWDSKGYDTPFPKGY